MTARRSQFKERPVAWLVTDAKLGSLGLDFGDVPADVAGAVDAAAEWARLAHEFRNEPVRFREGDRASLAADRIAWALYLEAARALLSDGLTTEGRSAPDRNRLVKNPALVAFTQVSTQLQKWAAVCLLTPQERLRAGMQAAPIDPNEEASVFGPSA